MLIYQLIIISMSKHSQKSIFFPKITETTNSQDLLLKKDEIVKSLQSQFVRNSFFYRSEHSKTTESKKNKRDNDNLELEQTKDLGQEIKFERNRKRYKNRKNRKQRIDTDPSQSIPITGKQKIGFTENESKSKKEAKYVQNQQNSNHFCFSLLNPSHKKYYLSKHKQNKVKTEGQQQSFPQLNKRYQCGGMSDLLNVKKAEKFEYIIPQEALQKKQRQNSIRQCLNSLKKVKQKKESFMQITSIKGWQSKLGSTCEYFI